MTQERRQNLIQEFKRQFLIHRVWIAIIISGAGSTTAVMAQIGACYLSLLKAVQTGQIDREAILKSQATLKIDVSTHITECDKKFDNVNSRIDNCIVNK